VRAGAFCRYRAIRDGVKGEPPMEEEWTFRVREIVSGEAKVEVEVLGKSRNPPSPSPREPGWSVYLHMKDDAYTGSQVLRLLHRPDLSPRGIRRYLEDEVASLDGSVRAFPVVVDGQTYQGREVTIELEDASLARARYRLVVVDELPVLGLKEADLDEVWISDAPDGGRHEERRHDHLELVESHR
jgi:hypothetical protein